ncbi:DNA double-strand break repair nuclease NurA [Pararhizobium sp. BT-229]|uniref:DNA double-strand break repair nuclease NurA n=1 Tax=Pararhizobium sp. BT-229 TaxID=2986923 RepID=UPI0021F7704E|nr:DNA double-strand break repair nuclease NurA [Pararhizobium sp. BT-229]MCV9964705.1 DNA double-strand break repair nuclease NurA [Pararhizobium sp. BT-229]
MTSAYGNTGDMLSRLLEKGRDVAARTTELASEFSRQRSMVRKKLEDEEMVHEVDESIFADISMPSLSAVDGAHIVDSRAIGDICAAVAVAAGPGDEPRNEVWMDCVPRNARNKEIVTGIMSAMEIRLAASSDAEIVMVDGSLTSALINISKAIMHASRGKTELERMALDLKTREMRDAAMEVLTSKRFVAVPKYTTTNDEFQGKLPESLKDFDGRTVATMALRPGEMMRLFKPDDVRARSYEDKKKQVSNTLGFSEAEYAEFVKASTSVVWSYYRPHAWTPAFRFDVPPVLYDDPDQGRRVLKAIHETTLSPGIREPLPLYIADTFAKQISVGVSPIMDMAAVNYHEDDEALILMIMGYRT